MPPKGIVPNLFGERKFYIGTDLGDMKPLNEITINAIETAEDDREYYECDYKQETITLRKSFSLQFKLRPIPKKTRLLFLQIAGLLKPRKTTYKTIRHDCAKRNGRR